jgi:hypothetical protein
MSPNLLLEHDLLLPPLLCVKLSSQATIFLRFFAAVVSLASDALSLTLVMIEFATMARTWSDIEYVLRVLRYCLILSSRARRRKKVGRSGRFGEFDVRLAETFHVLILRPDVGLAVYQVHSAMHTS